MADRKSRTRSVAYVGMTVALLAVSAWIALPLGPVPFTLQTFVLAFSLMVLRPGECLAALGAYLLLGAGVPQEDPRYGKPMHNEAVVFNEDVLPTGAALHTLFALRMLAQET